MSKAQVDPEALRQFAQDLVRFQRGVTELMNGLTARMRSLEGSWNDQEQRKFAEQFEQMTRSLKNFMEVSGQYSKMLVKKAEHIDNYLSGR